MTTAALGATMFITWRSQEKRIDIDAVRTTANNVSMALLKLQTDADSLSFRQRRTIRKRLKHGRDLFALLHDALTAPHETPSDFVALAEKLRADVAGTEEDVRYRLHTAERELERVVETLTWNSTLRDVLDLLRSISNHAEHATGDWIDNIHGGDALAYQSQSL